MSIPISLTVNGKAVNASVDPRTLLVHFIRENLQLTGTHVGCDTAQCGACTVHMNGRAVKSCSMLALQAQGAQITTIEGLAQNGTMHPMQEAFRECHGLQCGFCTPGMVMSAVQLLADNPKASEAEIREGLDGNICRCTGYQNIVKSIQFCQSAPSPWRSEEHDHERHVRSPTASGPIGQPLRRREDRRFLTGAGQYTDDVVLHGQTYGVFLRSPHAHARIKSINLDTAKAAPGVLQIFTGADLAEAKVGGLPCGWLIHSKDGTPMKEPPHPVLAQGKVRYVGDQVALVVAESLAAGEGRGRADRGRLRRAAGGDRHHQGRRQRQRGARRRARQRLLRLGPRRQGRGRCGVRQGRARDHARHRQQPPDPERDGAARRQRELHQARRELHALRRQPEPARRAPADVRLRARPARVEGARDRARRRRRLRLEDLPVLRKTWRWSGPASGSAGRSSGRPSAANRSSPTRTAATTSPTPSWRWTQRRQVPRAAREDDRQHGRLPVDLRVGRADHPVRDAARRPVQDAGDLRRGQGGVHQHRAGRRLPRRRPARRRPTSSSASSSRRRAR